MVISCSAAGCTNRQGRKPNVAFYRIPFDTDRRRRWLGAINRKDWEPSKYSRICSEHFLQGKKSDNPSSLDYVPSVFKSPTKTRTLGTQKSDMKKIKRKWCSNSEAAGALLKLLCETTGPEASTENVSRVYSADVMCHTDIMFHVRECQLPRGETFTLKNRLSSDLFEQKSFQNKDKLKAFTGLHNYQVLMAIFDLVKPALKDTTHMTCFQQLLITLMRLKVNLPLSFFSCLFDVHSSTVSIVFINVINVLNEILVPVCVLWPKKEHVQTSMPMCFRKSFKHCISIIDCFEILLDNPNCPKPRAHADSQYKSHNFMKYVVGSTPQGVISFVSKGWGGRTTDALIAANSGLLDHLLPGDVILADRGFTFQSGGLCCAKAEMAAFTRGKKQLSTVKVEDTESLAAVRTHVQRVTGQARLKYKMLNGPVPCSLLSRDDVAYTTLDKVVRVICALTNLSPSVVPSS